MNNKLFYVVKPLIPRPLQIGLRRCLVRFQSVKHSAVWPIDESAALPPFGWGGWPSGKKFAVVLTHDVDTAKGHEKCLQLMEIEEKAGFRSSFNFVPERYKVDPEIRNTIKQHGFEVGVHGLNHDGKLFKSSDEFKTRCCKINHYIREWEAVGFRSPSMHHNLSWIHDLQIEYDSSTFDTDPFEPQSDGVGTIFPFTVKNHRDSREYIELPYTIPQDFTVFILMKNEGLSIWKQKLDWVASKGGMVLLNSHPDYMSFNGSKASREEYPSEHYRNFMEYIKDNYSGEYWHALPREMAGFWKNKKTCVRTTSGLFGSSLLFQPARQI
jgi:hypothetical protein